MVNDYYKLPFGAQLLLWTSRVAIHGSCRSSPNKYELIGIAYNKVGIINGSQLLKSFLSHLINNSNFNVQPICKLSLIDNEINLINCVQEHKSDYVDNSYFIKLWSLEKSNKTFTKNCKNLANAFKEANLETDLQPKKITNIINNNYKYNTLH